MHHLRCALRMAGFGAAAAMLVGMQGIRDQGPGARGQGPGVRHFSQVHFAGWSALSAAGDAAATWEAVATGRSTLGCDAAIGWCGRLDDPRSAAEVAAALAAAAWHAAQIGSDALIDGAQFRPDWRQPSWRRTQPSWRQTQPSWRSALPGLSVATSKGDPWLLEAALAGDLRHFTAAWPGQANAMVAAALGWPTYVNLPTAAACASGLYGLLAVADAIAAERVPCGLAGAVDRSLTPLVVAGFRQLGVLCGDRQPGSPGATGFAPAEGAAAIALGPQGPWRLVAGVRLGDASHETELRDSAVLLAALHGLWSAAPSPDAIVIHGTGTSNGEGYEQSGLNAGPWRDIPRIRMKPVLGHTLGASGLVELVVALHSPHRRLWKLALGFGGHLAAVAVERD